MEIRIVMVSKYKVWWEDIHGNQFNEKWFNDFQSALYTFMYLAKKHDVVFIRQFFCDKGDNV